jgi:hypothetical protein
MQISKLGKCLRTKLEAKSGQIARKNQQVVLEPILIAMTNIVDLLVGLVSSLYKQRPERSAQLHLKVFEQKRVRDRESIETPATRNEGSGLTSGFPT